MEASGKGYYYPNRMGRIIFLAAEEILGPNGLKSIVNLDGLSDYMDAYPPHNQNMEFSFDAVSRLHYAIEEFYGPQGGRGAALRIGRACFQHHLREFGPLFGLTDIAFRLLPVNAKLKIGAAAFAEMFNRFTDQRVRLEDQDKFLLWHIERCPMCWERLAMKGQSNRPTCQISVGLLQEAFYWVSGGKYFNVEETHCIAMGDPTCTIVIEKSPMN
jgi:predicted hydrocarbon binding protein